MCLSTVVVKEDDKESVLCEKVARVAVGEDGKIVFTDLMGRQYTAEGAIQSIDLLGNTIVVA